MAKGQLFEIVDVSTAPLPLVPRLTSSGQGQESCSPGLVLAALMARHIKFLALAAEGKVVASHLHWDKENSEDYSGTQIAKSRPNTCAVRMRSV